MTNPTYNVTIMWQHTWKTTATQSTGGYYVATMNELSISATGSTYPDALDNLLTLVSDAPGEGHSLNRVKFF